jgi:hypothetical protein
MSATTISRIKINDERLALAPRRERGTQQIREMRTTLTITREVEITVEARYIPAVRATHMQPGEPADIEIIDAYDNDGGGLALTEAEVDEVREMILQDPPMPDFYG